jgi:ferredoxin-NADP reductase
MVTGHTNNTVLTSTTPTGEWEGVALVTERSIASDGVVKLVLRAPNLAPLQHWAPGAHVDITLPNGIVRQYSLTGDPAETGSWTIAVLCEPQSRGGSRFLHDQVSPGDELLVRGPRNHFPLREAPRYHFVAGGIGITPLLPMILTAARSGALWELDYCGRSRSAMAFLDVLGAWPDHVRIRASDEGSRLDATELVNHLGADTGLYCCGPASLLDAVDAACRDAGRKVAFSEAFSPKAQPTDQVNTEFEVEAATTGLTFTVPADRSILQVVREHGIAVVSSCEGGTCGTCEAGVLEGTPDHRDSVLTDDEKAENTFMMICVSRSHSRRLVLDL